MLEVKGGTYQRLQCFVTDCNPEISPSGSLPNRQVRTLLTEPEAGLLKGLRKIWSEMKQTELFTDTTSLYDTLCDSHYLRAGFRQVRQNKGSPGVDGITVSDFETRLDAELSQLQQELAHWTYQPMPVRRVEIPKPGGKGVRLLGVPTVRDRVVQATLRLLLEPFFDPAFSDHSYGFRPGRSQKQAVEAARRIVSGGKPYVVDIDLSKFFDRINHDRLIHRVSQRIDDKRILRLIGLMLRSGIAWEGKVSTSQEGAIQGSPLSPLLSNIILDELDKELERRGLEFCRYADDCNIFVKSQKAAERVMHNISQFIERRLKLVINREKSQVARSDKVKFLGMTIVGETIAISHKALQAAMAQVKALTPRGSQHALEYTIEAINRWYIGWSGYFQMTYYPSQLRKIEAHIRRRLRSRIVGEQKRKRHLYRKLTTRGVSRKNAARTVFSNRKRWELSNTSALTKAYPVKWFTHEMGQVIRSDQQLPHWFDCSRWIRLV